MSVGSSRWGDGPRLLDCGPGAVGLGDHPVAVLVKVMVVPVAQQHQVVEVGGAAVGPVVNVVGVAA